MLAGMVSASCILSVHVFSLMVLLWQMVCLEEAQLSNKLLENSVHAIISRIDRYIVQLSEIFHCLRTSPVGLYAYW